MRRAYLALMVLLGLGGIWAQAKAGEIPNAPACIVSVSPAGQPVQALERRGGSGFAAYSTWGEGSWPTITYSPAYFALPPMMQTFLSLHECGHLVLRTTNEFLANCYAVGQGRWTKADLDRIGAAHEAIGATGPQYGGSGAAFWAGTKRTCPQYFERSRGGG